MRSIAAMLCVALVSLIATSSAEAISAGTGGYIYWGRATSGNSYDGTVTERQLYRAEIDNAYAQVGSTAIFDCITLAPMSSVGGLYDYRGLEVLDPRSSGGTGSLVLTAKLPNSTTKAVSVLKVSNPTGTPTNSLLVNWSNTGTWNSQSAGIALPAPQNWIAGTQSNGVSLVLNRSTAAYVGNDGNKYYVHNQNSSSPVDNSSGNGQQITTALSSGSIYDLEFGNDRALYRSVGGKVDRTWAKSDGTVVSSIYYNNDCATVGAFKGGLAMGPGNLGSAVLHGTTSANNITYLFTLDGNGQNALFALQDLNGDNVIASGTDQIVMLWEKGNGMNASLDALATANWSGTSYMTQNYTCDLEVVVGTNGQRTLYFNPTTNGWVQTGGYLFAIDVADNGLALTGTAIKITIGIVPAGTYGGQGFEIDANPPAAIPEPTTLLLLGTGALGALGYVRRQRMK